MLTPLAIDVSRPFPLLSSLSLNLALLLEPRRRRERAAPGDRAGAAGLDPAGAGRPSATATPTCCSRTSSARTSRSCFPARRFSKTAVIRLARDAELELDDEGGRTHLELVERELRRRRRSDVVRLEVERRRRRSWSPCCAQQLDIAPEDVYAVPGPLDLRVLMGLTDLPGFDALRDPPLQPVRRARRARADRPVFEVLDERDVLLHHPYDAYDPVVALRRAGGRRSRRARDQADALSHQRRLADHRRLQRAAERNKQVTVLVELTARFDEERNIHWARALEEAGAHVIYGVRGYKTHAKICLVVRRSAAGPAALRPPRHRQLQRADRARSTPTSA